MQDLKEKERKQRQSLCSCSSICKSRLASKSNFRSTAADAVVLVWVREYVWGVNSNIQFNGHSIKQHNLTEYLKSPPKLVSTEILKYLNAWASTHVHNRLPRFSSINQKCWRGGGCIIWVADLWCNAFVLFWNTPHGCVHPQRNGDVQRRGSAGWCGVSRTLRGEPRVPSILLPWWGDEMDIQCV